MAKDLEYWSHGVLEYWTENTQKQIVRFGQHSVTTTIDRNAAQLSKHGHASRTWFLKLNKGDRS